jgi:hypothetical protein
MGTPAVVQMIFNSTFDAIVCAVAYTSVVVIFVLIATLF